MTAFIPFDFHYPTMGMVAYYSAVLAMACGYIEQMLNYLSFSLLLRRIEEKQALC